MVACADKVVMPAVSKEAAEKRLAVMTFELFDVKFGVKTDGAKERVQGVLTSGNCVPKAGTLVSWRKRETGNLVALNQVTRLLKYWLLNTCELLRAMAYLKTNDSHALLARISMAKKPF